VKLPAQLPSWPVTRGARRSRQEGTVHAADDTGHSDRQRHRRMAHRGGKSAPVGWSSRHRTEQRSTWRGEEATGSLHAPCRGARTGREPHHAPACRHRARTQCGNAQPTTTPARVPYSISVGAHPAHRQRTTSPRMLVHGTRTTACTWCPPCNRIHTRTADPSMHLPPAALRPCDGGRGGGYGIWVGRGGSGSAAARVTSVCLMSEGQLFMGSARSTDQRQRRIGYYASEEDAARAYDCAAVQAHGPGASASFRARPSTSCL
jgi:hypothetical protein